MSEETSTDSTKATPSISENKSLIFLAVAVGAIILIFLIIFLGTQYINPYTPEQITYNHFTFVKKDTHWMTDWQGNDGLYEAGFRFNPLEVEQVKISGTLNSSFNNRGVIYVTFDPLVNVSQKYNVLGSGELLLILKRVLHKNVEMACTQQDDNACLEVPIINCESDASVIFIKNEAPTKVELDNSCITIQGKDMELLRAIDRLLYQWLKIMR